MKKGREIRYLEREEPVQAWINNDSGQRSSEVYITLSAPTGG